MKIKRVKTEIWEVADLPERLLAAFNRANDSVSSVCREAGISTTTWYRLINGKMPVISHETLARICQSLLMELPELNENDRTKDADINAGRRLDCLNQGSEVHDDH